MVFLKLRKEPGFTGPLASTENVRIYIAVDTTLSAPSCPKTKRVLFFNVSDLGRRSEIVRHEHGNVYR
jgi:hypothetical protein